MTIYLVSYTFTRYVGDILIGAPKEEEINNILSTFNSILSRLQFTLETKKQINFLNIILIINEDNNLIFELYFKLTFSGRYLSYYSHYTLLVHKKSVILS